MPRFSNNSCQASTYGQLELARLMRACGNAANSTYHFFGCNTMTIPWGVPSALQSLGLSNGGNDTSFNPSTIENEVYQNYPIIFYAYDTIVNWHIWVCDGFDQHNYSQYNCDTQQCDIWSYEYFYMNWGWNGSSNGWYAANNFVPNNSPGINYNSGLSMISGIR